ncbi:MAG: peptide/nickel transport system substrate-binding protein [Solirubrobacteraceae bacterium]|nr:peptide/nickel transport system substrate-binding protein [Solirubrobacteraceae bacterium]
MRDVSVAVVATALVMSVAGCGGSSKADEAAASGTLVIALPTQPDNLNPIYGDNIYEGNPKAFNGLLRYDHDLNSQPDLAASLPTRSTDGKTVTVKLRDDVRFSDGAPLAAKDVAFTYNAIIAPKTASPMATLLDSLVNAKAVDERTVQFDLRRADPAFYDKLQIGILPEHLLAGKDLKNASFNRKPVGTGPYVVTEFQPGGRIVEEANPDYFRGSPQIKRIVLTAVEDENARVALLEKGTVDAAGVLPKLAPRVRRNRDYNVLEVTTADARTLALPNRDPVLKDPAVRRALSYGVDRQKIVDGALAGVGEPAYGPLQKGHWAYSPAAEVAFDPAKAGHLLDAAGWRRQGGGTRTKNARKCSFLLMYPAGDSVRKDIALAFSSQMADIGVDVRLQGLSFDVIQTRQDTGATEFGYGVPYDPDMELYTLYDSRFADEPGAVADTAFTNYPRMHSAKVDAALQAERSTLDRGARIKDFADMQAGLARDASWLYLVRLRHVVAISKRVHGVDPQLEPHAHGFSRGTSWNIEDWTLDAR